MRHFCTYFNKGYLARGLALHDSLVKHAGDFVLYVICLDSEVHEELTRLRLQSIRLIDVDELEACYPELLAIKPERPGVEYFFTLTPWVPTFLLETESHIDLVTYLDADLFFFSSCAPIFDEASGADVVIIPHRFPVESAWKEIFGRFNVGWVSFRRSSSGLECLAWWRSQCLAWCHDRLEDGRFADQKYLDEFETRFSGVHVLRHPGANLAPWNLVEQELSVVDGSPHVAGQPLVFFHFHGIERVSDHVFDTGLGDYGLLPGPVSGDYIYKPYFEELCAGHFGPVATLRRKHRPDGRKAMASATIVIEPGPHSSGHSGLLPSDSPLLAELKESLRMAQEGKLAQWRENRKLVLLQESTVRATEAGGLWLRHALTLAEQQRKDDQGKFKQLSKELDKQKETGNWLQKHPIRVLFRKLGRELRRAFARKARAPTPPAVDKVKLTKEEKLRAARKAWQALPTDVEWQWKDLNCEFDADFAARLLEPLESGQRHLLCHTSARTLAVAALLSSKGCHCTVLGAPGWLKKESTKLLSFRIERISDLVTRGSESLAQFDSLTLDTEDLEWIRPSLAARLWPRQKIFLVGGAWDGASGLGLGYHEVSKGLTYFPAPPQTLLHPDRQRDPRAPADFWPRQAPTLSLFPAQMPSGRPWPKITVVTVTRNQAHYFPATLDSVLDQGYPNLEYVVLDGASTDESPQILARYASRLAYAVSEPDKGQSDALNKGFSRSSGEIMTWLNSDDRHQPDTLRRVALAFDAHPEADMIAGGCGLVEGEASIPSHIHHSKFPQGEVAALRAEELLDLENEWMRGKFFYQPEVFWRRSLWEKAGGQVRTDLHYSMDYELWVRFAKAGAKIVRIPESLVLFRIHEAQKTHGEDLPFLPELKRVNAELRAGAAA